jgi:crossover junction endodeoxyribonuclease RusA
VNDSFFVEGLPAPQGSKSFRGMSKSGRAILSESSKAVAPWRKQVAAAAQERYDTVIPRPHAIWLVLRFVLPRPKSCKKDTPPHTKRPDTDKLARAVLDALTGTMYEDDSQVNVIWVYKRTAEPGEKTGVAISVHVS